VSSPYAADLELARRCAAGEEDAWDRFILEYRPVLYRAADALDPSGGARDLADSLYADLYGLRKGDSASAPGTDAKRTSLFRYFQGRSSLATWLRAVLAQRFVDRLRAQKRLQPLPDEDRGQEGRGDRPGSIARCYDFSRQSTPDPERARDLQLMQQTLGLAVADLSPKDRLRLACYYAQGLTLSETGRVLKEHEATVSRQLARTRRAIRENVERRLRKDAGLSDAQVARCFGSVSDDTGPIDLDEILAAPERKEAAADRSR
jgi:RNA polymerase sigma factor (sigma-70 family)